MIISRFLVESATEDIEASSLSEAEDILVENMDSYSYSNPEYNDDIDTWGYNVADESEVSS